MRASFRLMRIRGVVIGARWCMPIVAALPAFGLTLIASSLPASFLGPAILGLWLVLLGCFLLPQRARDALRRWRVRHSPTGRSPHRRHGVPITTMVLITTVGVGALVYHPPYLVVSPGPTFNVARDVQIDGRPTTPVNGEYLATTVRLSQPPLAQTVIAAVRPDQDVIRLSSVLPRDVPRHDYTRRQRAMYEESRRLAAAAAARTVGLPVTVRGTGVRVSGTVRDTPASELLRNGDVVIGVNGRRIGTLLELRHIVSAGPPGAEYLLTIERHGTHRHVRVRSVELPRIGPGTRLGIIGETRGLSVVLPFRIRFAERGDVGGPSAGLAYALAIADLLHRRDYASGRTIAATGTIDIAGSIGQVGGVTQKTVAADRAGADLFVVPVAEVREARGLDDVPVRGSQNLEQALDIIAAA
jgi:PDZ domain-containing protein